MLQQRLVFNALIAVVLCYNSLPVHGGTLDDLIQEIFTQAPESKLGEDDHSPPGEPNVNMHINIEIIVKLSGFFHAALFRGRMCSVLFVC